MHSVQINKNQINWNQYKWVESGKIEKLFTQITQEKDMIKAFGNIENASLISLEHVHTAHRKYLHFILLIIILYNHT